jgi:2-haloacid dehalogenase
MATPEDPPEVLIFDVNETLSDLAPLELRFLQVGAPGPLARTWFTTILRDGFALTTTGTSERFATIAAQNLRTLLDKEALDRELDDAVTYVMTGFDRLTVHVDVADGIRRLKELGLRLVTLSNGATTVAERLLKDSDLLEQFEALMSVEEVGLWKPHPRAYAFAVERTGVASDAAMLVAAHPWDTDGARRAGLSSAWIDRTDAIYPGHFLAPTLQASGLTDLADQIRRW